MKQNLVCRELKVKQNSVWSYRSLSYRSSWTESATTFSLKQSLLELSLVNWNKIQFEASAPWAIARRELKMKQNSVWSYRSSSYRSWTVSETKIEFEAIALRAIARRELKVKPNSVWSYCSLGYRSSWTESATTFSLKLSLLELSLVVNWKCNNIQFKLLLLELSLVTWKLKKIQFAVNWKWKKFSLKLSLLELSLVVNWKCNNIQFEAIAPWAIAREQKQNSVWSYCSLSYRSWTETKFSLKLLLLELSLVVNWKWNKIQFEAIAPRAIAREL